MNTLFEISRVEGKKFGPFNRYYVADISGGNAIVRLIEHYSGFKITGGWRCELVGLTDSKSGVVCGVDVSTKIHYR